MKQPPFEPEQRRRAVLAVVGALAEAVEGGLGELVAELAARAPRDLLAQHAQDQLGQRLGALQHHVAHEAVADDHVHRAVEQVPPSTLPTKLSPVVFSTLKTSRVRSVPFPSSSPIDIRPMRGDGVPITSWA